jgi:hypothetical protein
MNSLMFSACFFAIRSQRSPNDDAGRNQTDWRIAPSSVRLAIKNSCHPGQKCANAYFNPLS